MNQKQKRHLVRILLAAALLVVVSLLPLQGAARFFAYLIPYLLVGYDVLRKAGKGEGFTLIFIDPPYALDAVADAVSRILAAKLAKPGCLLVCESGSPDLLTKLGAAADKFDVQKEARYGITYITLLRYKGDGDEKGEES